MTFHNLARGIRHAKLRKRLLTYRAPRCWGEIGVGAPWVNVRAATSRVACVNAQFLRLAEAQNVIENAFHALLVKLIMVTEGDQITQQLLAIDFSSAILNLYGAPVRLVGDQAVRLQQMADQRLFHRFFTANGIFQILCAELVVIDDDILIVDTGAVKVGYRLSFQFVKTVQRYADITLSTSAQIVFQRLAYRIPESKRVWLKLFR